MESQLFHHKRTQPHHRAKADDVVPPLTNATVVQASDHMPPQKYKAKLGAMLFMLLFGGLGTYLLFFSSADTLVSNDPNTVVMQYILPHIDGPQSDAELDPANQQPFTLYGNGLLVCGHSYVDQFAAPRSTSEDENHAQPTARLLSAGDVANLTKQVLDTGFSKLDAVNYTYAPVSENEHIVRLVLSTGEKDVLYYNDGTPPAAYAQTLQIMQSNCAQATMPYVSNQVTLRVLADARETPEATDDSASDGNTLGGPVYDGASETLGASTTKPTAAAATQPTTCGTATPTTTKSTTTTKTTTACAAKTTVTPTKTATPVPVTAAKVVQPPSLESNLLSSAAAPALRATLNSSKARLQQNNTLKAQGQQITAATDAMTVVSGQAATDLQQKVGKTTQLVSSADGKQYQVALDPVLPAINNPLQLNRQLLVSQSKAPKVSLLHKALGAVNPKAAAYAVDDPKSIRIVILVPHGVSTSTVSNSTINSVKQRGAAVQAWYSANVGRNYKYDGVSVMQGSQSKAAYDTCPQKGVCSRGRADAVYFNVGRHDVGTLFRSDKITVIVPYWNLYSLSHNDCGLGGGNLALVPIVGVPDSGSGGRYCGITRAFAHELGHTFNLSHVSQCSSNHLMIGSPYCGDANACEINSRYAPACNLTSTEKRTLQANYSSFPAGDKIVTIQGRVFNKQTGKGVANQIINTCTKDIRGYAKSAVTDSSGSWSISVTKGTNYCARLVSASLVKEGYKPVNNKSGHENATGYQYQVAGEDVYHQGSKSAGSYDWDKGLDTNLDFVYTAPPRWHGWNPVGTTVQGDVAAVKLPSGDYDLFQCSNGQVYQKYFDKGHGWSAWAQVRGGGTCTKNVTATASSGNEQIFTVAKDGKIMHTWRWYGTKTWHSWVTWDRAGDGVHPGALITAISRDRNPALTDLFTSEKGSFYHRYYDQKWSSWKKVASSAGGLAAITRRGDSPVNVFTVDKAGSVSATYYSASKGNWQPPRNLNSGKTVGLPSATSPNSNTIVVFGRNTKNQLITSTYTSEKGWPKSWTTFKDINATGSPAVTSWYGDQVDVFVRGSGGKLYHNIYY